MSAGDKKQSLNPKVEKFLRLIRRNFIVSIIIVTLACLLAVAKLAEEGIDLWKKFQPPREPRLSIALLDHQRPKSDLTVNPHWKSRIAIGFSDSVPVVVALRNTGNAAATNIEVYMVYPPGVVNVQQSSGKRTFPAVLGDLTTMSGYENVETFSIARLDPSSIASVFEKELQLQFRFRQAFGFPILNGTLPAIAPLHFDFASSFSKKLGEFPITYVIKYSESEKPTVGIMTLRLDESKGSLLKRPDFNTTLGLVKKDSRPILSPGQRTDVIDVDFFEDGLAGVAETVSADCKKANPKIKKAKGYEETNSNDVWTQISFENGETYVFVDREKDGILDQVFLLFATGEWWELAPKSDFPYIPLNDIINSSDKCLLANIASKLGLKK